ncbi:hypothetical protein L7F22_016037 [Adiantum nelumboides]|nr:hypothetical protein [Adiantum nelumboides]
MAEAENHESLTIFYRGTVNAFQQVSNDRAKALMLLLADCSHSKSATTPTAVSINDDQRPIIDARGPEKHDQAPRVPFRSSTASLQAADEQRNEGQPGRPKRVQINSCKTELQPPIYAPLAVKRSQAELPFARKASLARFLERRKDRVAAALIKSQYLLQESVPRDEQEYINI